MASVLGSVDLMFAVILKVKVEANVVAAVIAASGSSTAEVTGLEVLWCATCPEPDMVMAATKRHVLRIRT